MSEYIIEIPDEYFASYDTERNMYYPDERDSAMPITPFVRCRDCKHYNDQDKEGIMMESIGKLRELCAKWRKTSITPGRNSAADEVDAIADEIEREIEDKIDDLMATSVDGYPEPFNTPDAMHMVLGTAADCFDTPQEAVHYLRGETSMLLPVDADGVPIHCGERMRLDNGHEGDVWLVGVFDIMMSDHTCFDWAKSRHVKPRTIEDVLKEFGKAYTYVDGECASTTTLIADYADELRSMGVGDD